MDQQQRVGEFAIEAELGRGAASVVYRVTRAPTGGRGGGDGPFALKLLNADKHRAAQFALHFRAEAATMARVAHPGFVRVFEVGEHDDQPYLLMELAAGDALNRIIKAGPMSEEHVVQVAKTVAGALAELHRLGMVHRDVKPNNITLSATTTTNGASANGNGASANGNGASANGNGASANGNGAYAHTNGASAKANGASAHANGASAHANGAGAVKLLDFGFVTMAGDRTGDRGTFVGTWLYAAPEQLGIIKRAIDGRADLYALGATLFECLTGQPPLRADTQSDFLTLVSTRDAPDVRELRPDVRPALAAIVKKLLAKDPDDRYQSAQALALDLERLTEIDQELRASGHATLGGAGRVVATAGDVAFVGRKKELEKLRAAWDGLGAGGSSSGAAVMIEGEGGKGKTRLVRELLATCHIPATVPVLRAKCQENEAAPFAAVREALDGYLAGLLSLPKSERMLAIARVREAAGDLLPWLLRLSRALREIVDDAGDAASKADHLPHRMMEAVTELLCGLAKSCGRVVIVIDDVQWIDDGSLAVIQYLNTRLKKTPILLLATARNDAASSPSTERFAKTVSGALKDRLALAPLSTAEITELVRAHLGGGAVEQAVVDRLAHLSEGNPFVIGEYVQALLERGILLPNNGSWRASSASAIAEVELPKNALQLIVGRLELLTASATRVLAYAAALGTDFDPELVATAAGGSADEGRAAIEEALRAHLVERSHVGAHASGLYAFAHDKIREAAYGRLNDDQAKDAHDALGRALEQRLTSSTKTSASKIADAALVYAVAEHVARGRPEKDVARAFKTNLAAGELGIKDSAYDRAYGFLARASTWAQQVSLDKNDTRRLENALGTACARTGRLEEALKHLEKALALAETKEERFELLVQTTLTFGSRGDGKRALDKLHASFDVLGKGVPRFLIFGLLSLAVYWPLALFLNLTRIGYGNAKGKERAQRKQLAECYVIGAWLGVFTGNAPLTLQFLVRGFLNAHFLGVDDDAAIAKAFYGAGMGLFLLKPIMRKWTNLGVQMTEQLGNPGALAVCRLLRGAGTQWSGDYLDGEREWTAASLDVARYRPGSWWASICLAANTKQLIFVGWNRDAVDWVRQVRPAIAQTNNLGFIGNHYFYAAHAAFSTGRSGEGAEFLRTAKDVYGSTDLPTYIQMGRFLFEMADHLDRREFGADFEATWKDTFRFAPPYDYYYTSTLMFGAYCHLYKMMDVPVAERGRARRRYKLAFWRFAAGCLVPMYRVHLHIMRAAYARFHGNIPKARRILDKAWRMACDVPSVLAQYYATLERARLERDAGAAGWKGYALAALEIAESEGYTRQKQHILDEFDIDDGAPMPSLLDSNARRSNSSSSSRSSSSSPISSSPISSSPSADGRTSQPPAGIARLSSSSHFGSRSRSNTASSRSGIYVNARYTDALLRVSLASASSLEPMEQARAALQELAHLLGGERALFFVPDDKTGELALMASYGAADDQEAATQAYSTSIVKRVWSTRTALVVSGSEEGEKLGAQSAVAHGLRSIITAPVVVNDKPLGVVYLDNRLAKGVFTDGDVGVLTGIANHIGVALEVARMGRVEADRRAMQKDLELSGAVQSHLLPKAHEAHVGALRLCGAYVPAVQCGGDWWMWEADEANERVRLFVGDVTGHGAGSAMATALVTGTYQTLRALKPHASVDEIVAQIDRALTSLNGDYLMTLSVVELDAKKGTLTWWNAGAPPLFVRDAAGKVRTVTAAGAPLGTGKAVAELGRASEAFAPGDRLLVCTDGVLEQEGKNGRPFGVRGTAQTLKQAHASPQQASDALLSQLKELSGGRPQDDDITFVVVDRA